MRVYYLVGYITPCILPMRIHNSPPTAMETQIIVALADWNVALD